jgi:DNA-binding response OmpR family regulator
MEESLDLLLADTADYDREIRAAALRACPGVRVKEVAHARDAVTSLSRGSYHALICAQDLGDLHASALIRMIRAGACGHPGLPIIVISPAPELHALSTTDASTHFLADSTLWDFAHSALETIRAAPKRTLLLVEDDPAHAEAAASMLRRYYRVEQARSGPAALDAWRARHHEVVLLDLMLPGMSGEQLQKQVIEEAPDQIIIVLTANSEPDKHPAMVLAGASAFLRKPVDVVGVTRTIEAILRDRQCNVLAHAARGSAGRLQSLAARAHAAYYSLSRGQAGIAACHLMAALTTNMVHEPSDDEWAMLLSEFDLHSKFRMK